METKTTYVVTRASNEYVRSFHRTLTGAARALAAESNAARAQGGFSMATCRKVSRAAYSVGDYIGANEGILDGEDYDALQDAEIALASK